MRLNAKCYYLRISLDLIFGMKERNKKQRERENEWKKKIFNQFLHTHKHDNSSANIRDTMRSVHTCAQINILFKKKRKEYTSTQNNERWWRCDAKQNESLKTKMQNITAKRTKNESGWLQHTDDNYASYCEMQSHRYIQTQFSYRWCAKAMNKNRPSTS